jgi:hypothetical protein
MTHAKRDSYLVGPNENITPMKTSHAIILIKIRRGWDFQIHRILFYEFLNPGAREDSRSL